MISYIGNKCSSVFATKGHSTSSEFFWTGQYSDFMIINSQKVSSCKYGVWNSRSMFKAISEVVKEFCPNPTPKFIEWFLGTHISWSNDSF